MNGSQTVDVIVIGRSISGFSVAINILNNSNKSVAFIDYIETLSVIGTSIIFPTELNQMPITGEKFEEITIQNLNKYKNYIELGLTIMVKSVQFQKEGFLIICESDLHVLTKQIVFAPNGSVPGWRHIPNIPKFYGLGVTQDAWSDASFTQGCHVVIAGYGDRVLDQANWLAKLASKITLICPNKEFSFSNQYQKYFQYEKELKAYKNCSILSLEGEENTTKTFTPLKSLKVKNQNAEFELECSYLFLADPVVVPWELLENQEETSEWMALKKLFVAGVANKVSYSDHKELYQDGKRCASALLKYA
jgi:thioredoxin reductase